jgi:regulator of protease activity HflC (stomatin/prohibitin superfamily)
VQHDVIDQRLSSYRKGLSRGVLLLVVVVVLAIAGACSVTTIDTGHVGVLTLFGQVTGERLAEGIHLINPMKAVTKFSVRTQESKEVAEVPSSEGLLIHLEASILYRLDPERATDVYQKIGPDYMDVVVSPNFRSVMRSVTAGHRADALYSEAREAVAEQMLVEMRKLVQPRGIIIENVLLRDIKLPATLKASIEAKQQADQDAQRMNFVLQKERQEAERKRIEAQGISDFQRIVTLGISQQLLEWKGIEATMEIAKSPNAKVVVIGNTKNGLPVIFSGQ